jgi:hypothetical protein
MNKYTAWIFVVAVVVSNDIFAANWFYVGESNSGGLAYIDVDSIRNDGRYIKYWLRIDVKPKKDLDALFELLTVIRETTQIKASCKTKESKTLSITKETIQRGVISDKINEEYSDTVPGSILDLSIDTACAINSSRNKQRLR